VLRSTRSAELSSEIRGHRLLLEARAISDTGRPQLALEIVESIPGPEGFRARSDILWAAKRFRESAEQLELMYGERWRDWTPLNDSERREVLRAALGFNLAEDSIGLDRFREKFGPMMLQSTDRKAFELVTSPIEATDAFNDVIRSIASFDTLDQFIRDIRTRAQDSAAAAGAQSKAPAGNPNSPPASGRQADQAPTGSIVARQ
jgi:hypothetical protein